MTPSVSMGVPTHDYGYFGEAVLGRNLKEFRIPLDAGRRLDAISDRLSVSGRYSYAIVEGSSTCRTIAATWPSIRRDGGAKTSAPAGVSWQRSHGGLRSTELVTEVQPFAVGPHPERQQLSHHRRPSYSLPKVDAFASLRALRCGHGHTRRARDHSRPEHSVRTLSASDAA